jgi:hypothetical protein
MRKRDGEIDIYHCYDKIRHQNTLSSLERPGRHLQGRRPNQNRCGSALLNKRCLCI